MIRVIINVKRLDLASRSIFVINHVEEGVIDASQYLGNPPDTTLPLNRLTLFELAYLSWTFLHIKPLKQVLCISCAAGLYRFCDGP